MVSDKNINLPWLNGGLKYINRRCSMCYVFCDGTLANQHNIVLGRWVCSSCFVKQPPIKPKIKVRLMKCWWCQENKVPNSGNYRQGSWLCYSCFPGGMDKSKTPNTTESVNDFSVAKWSFDPGCDGFLIRKKYKSVISGTRTETKDFEWYAEKSTNKFEANDYGEITGSTVYNFTVRKIGDKYRVKIEYNFIPEDSISRLAPKHLQRIWDCVIKDDKMFKKTIKELLEEIEDEEY